MLGSWAADEAEGGLGGGDGGLEGAAIGGGGSCRLVDLARGGFLGGRFFVVLRGLRCGDLLLGLEFDLRGRPGRGARQDVSMARFR